MDRNRRRSTAAPALALAFASAAIAQATWAADPDPFFDLELKEVLDLEITSVSKKPQTVSQAAAAIFVITADDIRRSGATTLPDLLRMAPGIQVAQISSNAWAVSARGLDGRFTNKLLVLMDGRSVYTPTFSGVYWDVQDAVLADIERIEVIRGPGAALWGANAVNGVINIITKPAAATQGGLATLGAGDEERGFATLRYGGRLGGVGHWRIYAKGLDRDGSTIAASGAPGDDQWHQHRVGFRSDFAPDARNAFTLQGDYYAGRTGESSLINRLVPPFNDLAATTQAVSGWNLLGRWQREVSPTDSFTFQGYYDHTRRDWPAHIREQRDTFDVDFQYRSRHIANHDLVFGAGYRLSRDRTGPSYTGVPADVQQFGTMFPASATRRLASVFLQDDVTLVPERLILTLGAKLERNDDTGIETQPNVRLLWRPATTTTAWASVARAVRTPSRIDRGGVVNFTVAAPDSALNPTPLPALVQAPADVGSETVVALEAGWKQRLTAALSVDLAVFSNDYDRLRTGRFGTPFCMPSGLPADLGCFLLAGQTHLVLPAPMGNDARARAYGAELAADWRPRPDLRLQVSLTRFSMRVSTDGDAFATDTEQSFARTLGSLRLAWSPRPDTDFDVWLRHAARLPEVTVGIGAPPIPAHTDLDLRLAWRPYRGVEAALVGRNLLRARHEEFPTELLDLPLMQIERSVFGQITFKF